MVTNAFSAPILMIWVVGWLVLGTCLLLRTNSRSFKALLPTFILFFIALLPILFGLLTSALIILFPNSLHFT